MRIYEELFIVKTDAGEEAIDPLTEQLKQIITSAGGEVQKIEKWGLRKLAYRIHKQEEGFYVLMLFSSTPAAVLEIERRLRVSDIVLKFITVRIDQKLKRVEKRKKQREKRAARHPAAPPAPAPAPQTPVGVEAASEAGEDKE